MKLEFLDSTDDAYGTCLFVTRDEISRTGEKTNHEAYPPGFWYYIKRKHNVTALKTPYKHTIKIL